MRLLTVLAAAALAAGVYHYRRQLRRAREGRQERPNEQLAEALRYGMTETDEPVGDLGPMQSGIASGR
jgi:Flp pilus assembly protein TadB